MKRSILITAISFLILAITAVITGCSKADNVYEETQFKMDTSMTIKAYGPGAKGAVQEAFERIGEIENLTSISISTSDVSRINDNAGREYVKVHPDVLKIIKESIKYSEMSGGAFDITIGPIVKLWAIGTKDQRIPSSSEIDEKIPLVGYNKIKINDADGSIMLEKQGMSIDLGGIAKGYAADQAVAVLSKHGIKKAIVNLGGSNINAIGSKSEDKQWSIGLQHPRKEQNAGYLGILKLSDKTVSTSGDYERYFIENGKRYHHILNPATGYPADSGVIADSIVIDGSVNNSSMDADALSTIVFILGSDKGMKFISGIPGVECVIATSDNRLLVTDGLKDKIDSISEDFVYDAQGR